MVRRQRFITVQQLRQLKRHRFNTDVALSLLIPEDSLYAQRHDGQSVDVSDKGMQLTLRDVPYEFFAKLCSQPRLVEVTFSHPGGEHPLRMTGRIGWVNYRPAADTMKTGNCFLGVVFSDDLDNDMGQYNAFLEHVESGRSDGECSQDIA